MQRLAYVGGIVNVAFDVPAAALIKKKELRPSR